MEGFLMNDELRDINDRVTEMMKIARQAGDDQLAETLWEASILLRRAKNRVDNVTSTASLLSGKGIGVNL
jgi:hypothetical protein